MRRRSRGGDFGAHSPKVDLYYKPIPAEARAFQLLGADALNQSICPEANAAREIGACFAAASYVVCYEPGVATADDDIDAIHGDLALAASRISLETMGRIGLGEGCGCAALRKSRPPGYADYAQGKAPAP